MKRKIILTILVTSFMLLTLVNPSAGYQNSEHNYEPAQHGEM
ncbi:Uncharacterised protein [Paenibacillus polymyxa]|uniref:Uncharacterized protein n=1 Tax=Paenibacillus polymyxa TaxID=1406 RepID=A0A378XX89_PAEPO|nr:Uncharacterised protein [Paenibacillus polymyxa]